MLVRIKERDLKEAGIPFSINTWYQWHSIGKQSNLFVKIGKSLFINLDEWKKFESKAITLSKKKALKNCTAKNDYFNGGSKFQN